MHPTLPLSKKSSFNKTGGLLAAVALALAGVAAYVGHAARRAEEAHPPRGRFIDVDGVRLHYIERGKGRDTILLLHGNGSMASDFEGSGLVGALAAHHRVIAFDRPGFGYSERPRGMNWDATEQARLIGSALQHLAIQKVLVVGHSWGTLPAAALALHAPHLVSKLVLISGFYFPTPQTGAILQGLNGVPVIGDVMRYTTSAIAARLAMNKFTERAFAPQQVPQRFVHQVPREMMLRPSQMRAGGEESSMMQREAQRLSERYADIPHPVTIMAGRDDGFIDTATQSMELHKRLPDSKLIVLEGVGHMLHYAAPLVVIAAIEDAANAATVPGKHGPSKSTAVQQNI